jgi:hypothetical protein
MTRRIKKDLEEFFASCTLTTEETNFILGCIRFQNKYAQCTNKQWAVVQTILERHGYDKSKGHKTITKR